MAASPVPPPVLTWEGVRYGVIESLPMTPAFLVFSLAIGALSVDKGLSLLETLAMSAFVFAGASQLMGLQAWQAQWDGAAVLAVALVVMIVNLRFVLMAAALHPFFSPMPRPLIYGTLITLTDGSFVVTTRAQREGRNDFGVFLGSGVFLWLLWMATTWVGFRLGHALSDPRRFGLDMVMPLVFATHLVPLVKGKAEAMRLPIAAVVAVIVSVLVEGYWFIIAGALAGSLAAALMHREE